MQQRGFGAGAEADADSYVGDDHNNASLMYRRHFVASWRAGVHAAPSLNIAFTHDPMLRRQQWYRHT
jgi:hypothetical protein